MIYKRMHYVDFDINNPHCLHVFLSNRAYSSIICEALSHGGNETGGLLIGHIIGRRWYVTDVIDPGTDTIHEVGLFQWEQGYVNQAAAQMRNLYRIQPTILGFWHRHPESMDYFSQTDVESTQKNLQNARRGLISMLVNIDPALRMTFYHCHGPQFMRVRYDVGDEYIPVELLEYASIDQLGQRYSARQNGRPVNIHYERFLPPPHAPGMEPKLSVKAVNDVPKPPMVPTPPDTTKKTKEVIPDPPKEEEKPQIITEEPVKEEPQIVTEEPVKEEPQIVTEEPAKEEPQAVTEESAKEEPQIVTEEPAKEEPQIVTEEPAKEEPPEETEKKKNDTNILITVKDAFSKVIIRIFPQKAEPEAQPEASSDGEAPDNSKEDTMP